MLSSREGRTAPPSNRNRWDWRGFLSNCHLFFFNWDTFNWRQLGLWSSGLALGGTAIGLVFVFWPAAIAVGVVALGLLIGAAVDLIAHNQSKSGRNFTRINLTRPNQLLEPTFEISPAPAPTERLRAIIEALGLGTNTETSLNISARLTPMMQQLLAQIRQAPLYHRLTTQVQGTEATELPAPEPPSAPQEVAHINFDHRRRLGRTSQA